MILRHGWPRLYCYKCRVWPTHRGLLQSTFHDLTLSCSSSECIPTNHITKHHYSTISISLSTNDPEEEEGNNNSNSTTYLERLPLNATWYNFNFNTSSKKKKKKRVAKKKDDQKERKRAPPGHWNDINNQRKLFDQIGNKLGVKQLDDWYNIPVSKVLKSLPGAAVIVNTHYRGSVMRALQAIYPEHPWTPRIRINATKAKTKTAAAATTTTSTTTTTTSESIVTAVPRGFWSDINNQRQFFDQLGAELGVQSYEDWYNISLADVYARRGSGLLSTYYGNSMKRALEAIYPEHQWDAAKFTVVPRGHWTDIKNQRKLFDEIAAKLGIQHLDDWYKYTNRDVISAGRRCAGLMRRYYDYSLARALKTIYPEHPWQSWRFKRIPSTSVSMSSSSSSTTTTATATATASSPTTTTITTSPIHDHDHDHEQHDECTTIKEYLAALAQELGIRHLDDWKRVSVDQLRRFGGYGYIERSGGLHLTLKRIYPEHNWDDLMKRSGGAHGSGGGLLQKKAAQRQLLVTVQRIFPDAEVLEDYLHPELHFSDSNQAMEIDIYIPELRLGFEYQGEQHYSSGTFALAGPTPSTSPLALRQDHEKAEACARAGITLVRVPYWLDLSTKSIASAVLEQRPDLAPHMKYNDKT